MFPQDIALWQGSFYSIYPQYQLSPWWGNITDPEKKPRATYTTTGTQLTKTDAFFKENANLNILNSNFGYAFMPSPGLAADLDVSYTIDALRDKADGRFSSVDSAGVLIGHIPFDYSLSHTLSDMSLRGLASFLINGIPIGLRLNFGFENTLELHSGMTFTKNDSTYSTGRALWGWTTSPCAHIFGAHGVEGDAWLQDNYAEGPIYKWDIQSGATLPWGKFGLLYHQIAGSQVQYSWVRDYTVDPVTGDTIIKDSVVSRNFQGHYQKSDWAKQSSDLSLGMYGNCRLRGNEHFDLNSFFSIAYLGSGSHNALGANPNVQSSSRENRRGFALECDPNISIKLGGLFHYIDAEAVFQYEYDRFYNTYDRWVGGGMVSTYWESAVNGGDEDVWENYSYANQNALDAGADISAMFPLVNNAYGLLGLGMVLFGNSRYTFLTKYYGTNGDNGVTNTFTVNNVRRNLNRELSFNSVLMLNYVRRPYYLRLEMTEPVLFSFMPRTTITDASGRNVLYTHTREPLWLSRQGLHIGLFFSCEFVPPFLRQWIRSPAHGNAFPHRFAGIISPRSAS
jgi:hypothetical protein